MSSSHCTSVLLDSSSFRKVRLAATAIRENDIDVTASPQMATRNIEKAHAIAQANLLYSNDGRLPLRSLAHSGIAELGIKLSDSSRRFHHDEAVRLARVIGRREVLLQVLVARG